MSENQPELEPLIGDPRRRASASERGYIYQFWRTVDAWIDLGPDETLYVEGAEDFDRVADERATCVQIKDDRGSGSLTLSSADAIAALGNYWSIREKNSGRMVRFQYVTTRTVGIERTGFAGRRGIEIWEECRCLPPPDFVGPVEELKAFILSRDNVTPSLASFLSNAHAEEVHRALIRPFEWLPDQPELDDVRESVLAKLVSRTRPKGLPVEEVERLARDLYMRVEEAAIQRTPQRLDAVELERILDRFAFLLVPRAALVEGGNFSGIVKQFVAELVTPGHTSPAVLDVPLALAPPVLPSGVWPRYALLEQLRGASTVSRVAWVHGGTGTGKTTLVRQALEGTAVLWLDLRDRSARDIVLACHYVAAALDSVGGPPTVVLDDLNPSGDSRLLENELARLVTALRAASGTMILVSYSAPPPRLLSALDTAPSSIVQILPFTDQEIASYLRWLGCTDSSRADVLGRVVWAHSLGHPQLVAVRARALAAAGFPSPRAKDLLGRPSEMEDVVSEALALIRSTLPDSARDLLYRLSLVFGTFRRSHVLRLASLSPTISRPGEVLDMLAGPWLEQPTPDSYRVSPLASRAGSRMLDPEEVKRLHGQIATALLADSPLSTQDFSSAALHTIIGEAEDVLPVIAHTFLTAPRNVQKAIAEEVHWISSFGVGTPRAPFSNPVVRRVFRLLQWEIATLSDSCSIEELANVMESELPSGDLDLGVVLPRIIYLSKLLLHSRLRLPIGEIIEKTLELGRLVEWSKQQEADLAIGDGLPRTNRGREKPTLLDWFSTSLVSQVRGPDDLSALIDAVDHLGSEDRNRILGLFHSDDGDLRFLFSGAWIPVPREDKDAQREFAAILRRAVDAGKRWDYPHWTRAAVRQLAAVLDECLGDSPGAKVELEKILREVGASPNLKDQLAIIAFNQKDYESALSIWREILPVWKADEAHDLQPVFSTRSAAVCAGYLGLWAESAELFSDAERRASRFPRRAWTLGMVADRAHALWEDGQRHRSADLLVWVVEELERAANHKEASEVYAVQKLAGHLLGCLADMPQEAPAVPGMCSVVEPNKEILELPPTPVEYHWYFLFRMAERIGRDDLRKTALGRMDSAPYSMLRLFAAKAHLRDAMESELSAGVLVHALSLAREMRKSRERGELPPHERDPEGLSGRVDGEMFNNIVLPPLLGKLIRTQARLGRAIEVVQGWMEQSQRNNVEPVLQDSLRELELFAQSRPGELKAVLMSSTETTERRALAAALLCGSEQSSPTEALYAHVVLFQFEAYDWVLREMVAEDFDQLVRKVWLRLAETPALFLNPRLHVPSIQQACAQARTGWSAVARVLLAVIPAVSLGVSAETIRKLRAAAETASPAPPVVVDTRGGAGSS